jgi:hypothetical protein
MVQDLSFVGQLRSAAESMAARCPVADREAPPRPSSDRIRAEALEILNSISGQLDGFLSTPELRDVLETDLGTEIDTNRLRQIMYRLRRDGLVVGLSFGRGAGHTVKWRAEPDGKG